MWKYLLKKEFKQFLRDPGMPRMTLMFPFLIILVFPYASSMEVHNIKLAMVDNDHSTQSVMLMEKCASSGYFKVESYSSTAREAQEMMDDGRIDAILTINQGFERHLQSGASQIEPLPVGIKVNTVNGTRGSIGSQYLNACVTAFVTSFSGAGASGGNGGAGDGGVGGVSAAPSAGGGVGSAPSAVASNAAGVRLDVSETYRNNPFMDYKLFMIPALIVIAITMMCGFLPALNIVSEKEKGTIEQINVTPVRKTTFILCKMIPYVCVAYFMVYSCLFLAYLAFGYVCKGSLLDVGIFTFAHIVVMASFGLLVSNYSDNAQQAMFVIWFFSMIFMLMSGIFTPIESMPEWAEIITYANPLRYFADAMRGIFLKGSTLADTWFDLVCLFGIGFITTFWAILSYRKTN